MKLFAILALALGLQAATITVTVTDDAGKQVSTSTTTTSDAVLQAFQTRMAVEITRQQERTNQGRQVPTAIPPSVADAVKEILIRMMPHPADANLKKLQDQMQALQKQIQEAQAAQVK